MEDKTVTRLFEDMRDDVASFVRSNIELAKLETFEKLSKASATTSVTMVLIRVLTLFLALLLLSDLIWDTYWMLYGWDLQFQRVWQGLSY